MICCIYCVYPYIDVPLPKYVIVTLQVWCADASKTAPRPSWDSKIEIQDLKKNIFTHEAVWKCEQNVFLESVQGNKMYFFLQAVSCLILTAALTSVTVKINNIIDKNPKVAVSVKLIQLQNCFSRIFGILFLDETYRISVSGLLCIW